jgi:hypothetical protein
MELASNIDLTTQPELADRLSQGKLTIADHLILTLASFTSALFPDYTTYIGAQQQGVKTPALFVDFYDIKNNQKLIDTDEFQFGIEITYVPSDQTKTYEMQNAIFTIQQNLFQLTSDIGVFSCYDKDSDITDGLAHVTGTVTVGEIIVDNSPLIQIANQNIKGAGPKNLQSLIPHQPRKR